MSFCGWVVIGGSFHGGMRVIMDLWIDYSARFAFKKCSLLIKLYCKIINIMLTVYIQGPPTSTDHVSADEGIEKSQRLPGSARLLRRTFHVILMGTVSVNVGK
jgi:hypothetical protein